MNMLKIWMAAATPDEQRLLAERAGTSRQYLYRLATDKGKAHAREPQPDLAAALERETAAMHKASKGRLPRIYRTDMAEVCRQCEFAQKCLGPAAVRADFPIVTAEMVAEAEGEGT